MKAAGAFARWSGAGLLVLLLSGCASLPGSQGTGTPVPDAPARESAAPATSHLMVTLKPGPKGRLDQATSELAEAYGLELLAAWQITALDRRCVVFGSRSPLEGRRLETLLRSLRADPRVHLAQAVQNFVTLADAGGAS